ncbi:XRE family transcriptional regulator [Marinospirillum insulare]|uniref:HTH cro/C1-type domain-containing protein n=1 Tax=Marinospirillum insulare TaxID=217169 RepID=A0ABQ6A1F7_9GAMM|nr:LexA family transcriptional regulator [Marinospirillum insulare]GLR63935.1 hypothetical protein GCM10007878_13730 [Marinospirillum insulare]
MRKINSTDKVLRELMRVAGVNQVGLSRKTGVKQSTISRILNPTGSSGIKNPTDQQLRPLADFLACTVDQLRGYQALDQENLNYSVKEDELAVNPAEPRQEFISLLSASSEPGTNHFKSHNEIPFHRDWLSKMGVKPVNLRATYAVGNSMYPSIADGDVLLVNICDQQPKSGKVYALYRPDNSISIKRLNEKLTGGWIISNDNPNKHSHPDEECDDSILNTLPIAGRVVWRGGSVF